MLHPDNILIVLKRGQQFAASLVPPATSLADEANQRLLQPSFDLLQVSCYNAQTAGKGRKELATRLHLNTHTAS